MVSRAPSVFNTAVSKFSTLHFFGYSPANGCEFGDQRRGWWRIIRTTGSDTAVDFQRLVDVDAERIKERLKKMDRESLRHFDIDTFTA